MIEIEIDNGLKTVLLASSEQDALDLMSGCDCGYKLKKSGKVFFIKKHPGQTASNIKTKRKA